MEDDILDDFREVKSIQNAKASFALFITVITVIAFFYFLKITRLFSILNLPLLLIVLSLIIFLLLVIGLLKGIKSYRLKEPSIWHKYIGFFGNLLLCLFTLILLIPIIINTINNF